ncbi:hypothetical protein ACFPOE_18920 [Caenimonas terrae]|uniref:Uncharacterized protein n=1 Tax=Caenimonas terrae TaxID=696074 RepID=A0ABW0NIU4_9BURK
MKLHPAIVPETGWPFPDAGLLEVPDAGTGRPVAAVKGVQCRPYAGLQRRTLWAPISSLRMAAIAVIAATSLNRACGGGLAADRSALVDLLYPKAWGASIPPQPDSPPAGLQTSSKLSKDFPEFCCKG